jgi:uncharacterized short protein YbdD (DUF466 family)
MSDRTRQLLRLVRRILGMPDYEAYVAHLRAVHPGCPLPSERQYFEEFVRAKYSGGPTRCC